MYVINDRALLLNRPYTEGVCLSNNVNIILLTIKYVKIMILLMMMMIMMMNDEN